MEIELYTFLGCCENRENKESQALSIMLIRLGLRQMKTPCKGVL
jgi:hypothetical protein